MMRMDIINVAGPTSNVLVEIRRSPSFKTSRTLAYKIVYGKNPPTPAALYEATAIVDMKRGKIFFVTDDGKKLWFNTNRWCNSDTSYAVGDDCWPIDAYGNRLHGDYGFEERNGGV